MSALVVLLALMSGQGGVSVQSQWQEALAVRLRTGTVEERLAAVGQVLRIPSQDRAPALVQALADELSRVNALSEKRRVRPGVVDSEWDTVGIGEDYGMLVEANARTGEPVAEALPALVGALGTGKLATDAVARFGSAALPQVLAALNDADAAALTRSGAAIAIHTMLRDGRLGNPDRERVVTAVRDILSWPQHVIVYGASIDLAVATGNLTLLGRVQQIAADSARALPGSLSSSDRSTLMRRAQRALKTR
jgi:hypothetical protein